MNLDNDFDDDGNNIVPCPICLDVHCPSKEGGECPDEEEYVRHQIAASEKHIFIPSEDYPNICKNCGYGKHMENHIVLPFDQ